MKNFFIGLISNIAELLAFVKSKKSVPSKVLELQLLTNPNSYFLIAAYQIKKEIYYQSKINLLRDQKIGGTHRILVLAARKMSA